MIKRIKIAKHMVRRMPRETKILHSLTQNSSKCREINLPGERVGQCYWTQILFHFIYSHSLFLPQGVSPGSAMPQLLFQCKLIGLPVCHQLLFHFSQVSHLDCLSFWNCLSPSWPSGSPFPEPSPFSCLPGHFSEGHSLHPFCYYQNQETFRLSLSGSQLLLLHSLFPSYPGLLSAVLSCSGEILSSSGPSPVQFSHFLKVSFMSFLPHHSIHTIPDWSHLGFYASPLLPREFLQAGNPV